MPLRGSDRSVVTDSRCCFSDSRPLTTKSAPGADDARAPGEAITVTSYWLSASVTFRVSKAAADCAAGSPVAGWKASTAMAGSLMGRSSPPERVT